MFTCFSWPATPRVKNIDCEHVEREVANVRLPTSAGMGAVQNVGYIVANASTRSGLDASLFNCCVVFLLLPSLLRGSISNKVV